MHFKVIPTFAETTTKKKIDEAKQGAFNQSIKKKSIILKYFSQYFFTFAVFEYFLRKAVPILLCLVLNTGRTKINDDCYTDIY